MRRAQGRSPPLTSAKSALAMLKKKAIGLAGDPAASFADLAKVLAEIDAVSSPEFRKLALSSELGISPRMCYYLVSIWSRVEGEAEEDRLTKLGWSKLRVLAPHLTSKNAARLFEFAEKHTVRECQLHLNKQPFAEETRCMLLRFSVKDYTVFSDAVTKYGARKRGKGLADTEKALLKIISKVK